MGENPKSPSHDFLGFGNVCRACKSFVSKCYPDRKNGSPKNAEIVEESPKFIHQDFKKSKNKKLDEETVPDSRLNGNNGSFKNSFKGSKKSFTHSPQWSPRVSGPSPLSQSASFRWPSSLSRSGSTTTPSLSKSTSQRNSVDGALSRMASTRKGIMFSNSSGVIKPPAIEEQLQCTLEELCFGCTKKIKIIRDAVTDNGQIIEEEEVLTVKLKPGWTKGTRITFEGMGNEIPGTYPSDVAFVIAEKRHSSFSREGDDLHLRVEIPLVKALTGCNISVPLLGGEKMNLIIDDIIHHGYEKIVLEQGMPMQKESSKRGNLVVKFSVNFPEQLTDQQRTEVVSILVDNC